MRPPCRVLPDHDRVRLESLLPAVFALIGDQIWSVAVIVTMAATSDALAAALELFLVTPGGLSSARQAATACGRHADRRFRRTACRRRAPPAHFREFNDAKTAKLARTMAALRGASYRRRRLRRECAMLQASGAADPRRSVAAELPLYGGLAGTAASHRRVFGLAEVFRQMVDGGGLHRGFEFDICSAAAMWPIAPTSGRGDNPVERDRRARPDGIRRVHRAFLVGTGHEAVADALRPSSVAVSAGLTVIRTCAATRAFRRSTQSNRPRGCRTKTRDRAESADGRADRGQSENLGRGNSITHHFGRTQDAEAFARQQLLRVAGRALDKAILGGSASAASRWA